MKRQYHTPEGIVLREATKEELDFEWNMKRDTPDFQLMRDCLAELTGKTKEEVEAVMKKNYRG